MAGVAVSTMRCAWDDGCPFGHGYKRRLGEWMGTAQNETVCF